MLEEENVNTSNKMFCAAYRYVYPEMSVIAEIRSKTGTNNRQTHNAP